MQDIIATEQTYTSGAYPKREIALVRGKGVRVWDAEGREYIDCIAGHGVANVGHCHPTVTAAIQEQAATLVTASEAVYNDQRATRARKRWRVPSSSPAISPADPG